MSGKRLLDLLALAGAGRSIVAQRWMIRQSQLQKYGIISRPKVFSGGVKETQGGDVNRNAGAAADISMAEEGMEEAKEMLERKLREGPRGLRSDIPAASQWGDVATGGSTVALNEAGREAGSAADTSGTEEGYEQAYEDLNRRTSDAVNRTESASAPNAANVETGLGKSPSSRHKMILQREYEQQIPQKSAEAPTESPMPGSSDLFYLRSARVTPSLSRLPRMKIPKKASSEQPSSAVKQGANTEEFYETPAASEDTGYKISIDSRTAQQKSEKQIPATPAEAPSEEPHPGSSDLFYFRSARLSPSFSSLPRMKIPKKASDAESKTTSVFTGTIPEEQSTVKAEKLADGAETAEAANDSGSAALEAKEIDAKATEKDSTPVNARVQEVSDAAESAEVASDTGSAAEETKEIEKEIGQKIDAKSVAEEVGGPHTTSKVKEEDLVDLETALSSVGAKKEEISEVIEHELHMHVPKRKHELQPSAVPSTRIGRLFHYGSLGASLAFGAMGEGIRRIGSGGGEAASSVLFSEANVERLVKKLSRMRGAALKLGQMLSIQDSKLLPPALQEVLTRVQDSADYMPAHQRDKVLKQNLGPNWRDLFSEFEEVPMAAASIGQVHGAVLADGTHVAVKIQYPGVAESIDSDLDNLSILLTASKMLPKGLYLDKTIANARTELAWECDYLREADAAEKFRALLKDESDVFTIPRIIPEASGKSVLTMERLQGIAVTRIVDQLSQDRRDYIGTHILRLCLLEVAKFNFMQTDPNWTNFLWNDKTRKIELLDFGASREYDKSFVDLYLSVLRAAARGDRKACEEISLKLGYLTGFETPTMINAHVDSILTLAEPFRQNAPEVYDFSNQTITQRVKDLIPVMIRERLSPPPEETYSLHRKMSGAFLLCARLGSKVRCRDIFAETVRHEA